MGTKRDIGAAVLLIALAIVVAGCGAAGVSEAAASDATAAQTGAVAGQEAPTSTPVTLLPDTGTAGEGSPDGVAVADVVTVNAGERFTKVWRLRNTGTRGWSDGAGQYTWLFVGGDQMSGPSQVPILDPVLDEPPPAVRRDVLKRSPERGALKRHPRQKIQVGSRAKPARHQSRSSMN